MRIQDMNIESVSRFARDLAIMENTLLRIAALPDLSRANPDEIIGYDQDGLPT